MHAISRSFSMLWDALFLQTDAYERMRDDDNPFVEGLFLLVLLGLLLAVVGIVGTTLEWASSPPLAAFSDDVVIDRPEHGILAVAPCRLVLVHFYSPSLVERQAGEERREPRDDFLTRERTRQDDRLSHRRALLNAGSWAILWPAE